SEKNSSLVIVRSMLSTATSVNRLVSATSSICPPATGHLLQLPLAPARLPGEAEVRGGELHAQLVGALRIHHWVGQRDLHCQPVEQRGEQHREVYRVDGAELARLLPRRHERADEVPLPLVELLPYAGHLGMAHRLCP